MKHMTSMQLRDYLNMGIKLTIVDVREVHELQHGMLEDAIHVPIRTVKSRMNEFEQNKAKPIVLVCRSGKRSDQVGQYLEQFGFSAVINLIGGMNAWATDIDKSMTVY